MRIPAIRGVIDRRILANFRIDAEVLAQILPAPFQPKLAHGFAIGGICLIRLKAMRPRCLPLPWGLRSENAAHRFAVEWVLDGERREGVYVPRRDTSSRLTSLSGGSVFPGIQHFASFQVAESGQHYSVVMNSSDGQVGVHVSGTVSDHLPSTSIFSSVEEVSRFFEAGSVGYSDSAIAGRYDGMELQCDQWQVEPLAVDQIESSFFADSTRFPRGSITFDCALLMRGIHHEWHGREDLCCTVPAVSTS